MASHCKYPVHLSPYYEEQSRASIQWLANIAHLSKKEEARYVAVKFGLLISLAIPYADVQRLRVSIDWMNYIFWLDDQLEAFDVEGNRRVEECCIAAMRDPIQYQTDELAAILTKSWCGRMEQASSTAFKERFMVSMKEYFQGVREQVEARIQNRNTDTEEYMTIRWHSSGIVPSLLLADFCRGAYLPDYVHNHPTFNSLRRAAGEHVIYVNDIVSYDRESREDSHNLVCVVMKTKGYSLQEAMDFVGQRANECIDRFEYARQKLPSWGPEVDTIVADFTAGYEHWVSGHLHWALSSERYFGDIKNKRVVKLRQFWRPLKYERKGE
ncbi:terpene synthase [Amanita muscaria]